MCICKWYACIEKMLLLQKLLEAATLSSIYKTIQELTTFLCINSELPTWVIKSKSSINIVPQIRNETLSISSAFG